MPPYEGPIVVGGEDQTVHNHTFVGVYQALIDDFPGRAEQARIAEALLSDVASLEVRYTGVEDDEHAVFIVSVGNENNGHNLPSGATADTQVWVHLQVYDGANQLVYESGMTDANGDLMDGVQGHSLDPDGDPELLLFGQHLFDAAGEHVTFAWEAHSRTDNLIGPGQKKWRDYSVPVERLSAGVARIVAVLKYRTLPPFFIRTLVESGYLDPSEIGEVPIIEMERFEGTFTL